MQFLENRIPPPIVALLFAAFMWGIAALTATWPEQQLTANILATLIALIAAAISIAAVISFRLAKTTVNPLKPDSASSLVTSGIFRISRNPMYVSFTLFLLAWAIYLTSALSFIAVPAYAAYMQHFQIRPEETAMRALFAQEFIDYQQRVSRWL